MLCFRCEHRAKFLEGGRRPRYECGEIETSKGACYMWQPMALVVTGRLNKDDPRPEHGGYFGCRMQALRLEEGIVEMKLLENSESVLIRGWKK